MEENRPPSPSSSPWLLYTSKDDRWSTQKFCTMSPLPPYNDICVKSIPELNKKQIRGCCNGWLILRDIKNYKMMSLYNPVTSKILHLPPLKYSSHDCGTTYTLMSTPDHDDCVLFLFSEGKALSCRPTKINPTWVKQRLKVKQVRVPVHVPVVLDRTIYALAITDGTRSNEEYTTISMKVADEGSNFLTLKNLQLDWPGWAWSRSHFTSHTTHHYLIVSCGHVYCVTVSHLNISHVEIVQVWKLDFQGRNWVDVRSLEGRSFFVAENASTWCWGSTSNSDLGLDGVEGDCIYFVSRSTIFSYSLQEDNLTLLCACPNLDNHWNSSEIWMALHKQRMLAVQETKETTEEIPLLRHGFRNLCLEETLQPNETQESLFLKLPSDVIQLISQKMHLLDYWSLRGTSKLLKSIIPYPARVGNPAHIFLPMLMAYKFDGCEVMAPNRSEPVSKVHRLSCDPSMIKFSKGGWLITIVGRTKSIQFFNLLTGEKGNYPLVHDEDFEDNFSSIGLSSYPTSSDCLTVGLFHDISGSRVYVRYHKHGEETWQRRTFEAGKFYHSVTSPIYSAGAFYFLDRDGYLGQFTLSNEEANWQVYQRPMTKDDKIESCHLVEYAGELHAVFIGDIGKCVQVFKFNISTKNWVSAESLENHCLFISHVSSFSYVAKDVGLLGNRIYFPRLKGKGIVFYSLDTRMYGVTNSDEYLEDFRNTKEPLRCFWN